MASTRTTIPLRKETREMLRTIGSKNQNYDGVIRDCTDKASIRKMPARWNRIREAEEFIPLDEL